MNFCFTRFVSSHMISTVAVVVHIVFTNGFGCDNVGKCLCTDYEHYREANCSNKGLNVIPEGLQSAHQYLFNYNYFDTTSDDFRMSWNTFWDTVNVSIATEFDFSSNPLMGIPEWLFDERLTYVSQLELSKCQISSLTENAFSKLENLDLLNISGNPLLDLPAGLFRNQLKLYQLDLGSNNIQFLPANILGNLISITSLVLQNNKLEYLPPELFKNNKKIIELLLDNNRLEYLPPEMFKHNTMMMILTLNSNRLEYLPPEIFKENILLTSLNLGNNRLEYLPPDIFKENTILMVLDLENNRLEYLPPDFLIKSPMMWMLKLTGNKMKIMDLDRLYAFSTFIEEFYCTECFDCNCKTGEDFSKWADQNDFNSTNILSMMKVTCTDGTPITNLKSVNDCPDLRYPNLAGIVTTVIGIATGTLASITAVFLVSKRIIQNNHFEEESDGNPAENDIEINLTFHDGLMMVDELFRNIPPVDHRIYIQ